MERTPGIPDDIVRRSDPEHQGLLHDVRDIKGEMVELKLSSHRTERYLVGGWTEDGSTYLVGVRERVTSLEKVVRWFWAIATGVWAIALTLIAQAFHLIPMR